MKGGGLSRTKLININCLFVKSSAEYCAFVWHENLTQDQSKAMERLQIVGLKIFVGKDCPKTEDGHFDYEAALILCKLES